MIAIYRLPDHDLISRGDDWLQVEPLDFDALFRSENPLSWVESKLGNAAATDAPDLETLRLKPPVGSQEIWAAGVTYYRSREARMEEAEQAGGDVFYDLVYDAERPELFFKATASRARGHLDPVAIRSDSTWDVPEPELTLAINTAGEVFGYTIGNDMSSRSIEGDNPLYLPQAKVYRGSCAIGPALVISEPLPTDTPIQLEIIRTGETAFEGQTHLHQIKREFAELAGFLFRDNEFPDGAYLMTGTGVVPDSDFTLQSGDVIRITISGLGTLENVVE